MPKTESQKLVAEFIVKEFRPTSVGAWLLDLESEMGELAKEWLRTVLCTVLQDNAKHSPRSWSTSERGREDALRRAITKYEARVASTGMVASGK